MPVVGWRVLRLRGQLCLLRPGLSWVAWAVEVGLHEGCAPDLLDQSRGGCPAHASRPTISLGAAHTHAHSRTGPPTNVLEGRVVDEGAAAVADGVADDAKELRVRGLRRQVRARQGSAGSGQGTAGRRRVRAKQAHVRRHDFAFCTLHSPHAAWQHMPSCRCVGLYGTTGRRPAPAQTVLQRSWTPCRTTAMQPSQPPSPWNHTNAVAPHTHFLDSERKAPHTWL